MTPDEERDFWLRYVGYTFHKQRRGQALWNALYVTAPILAEMIRGTDADPFHRESAVPAFCEQLGIAEP